MDDKDLNPIARAEAEAQRAEIAESPGRQEFFKTRGEDDSTMTPQQLDEAGWSYIFHRETGLRSTTTNNMLLFKLRHRNAFGEYIWSTTPPGIEPEKGEYKCILHPDDPHREEYKALGFNRCSKSNLTSPYQVRRHMMKRHKVEWEAIDQARKDAERVEDRATQRAMMEAIKGIKATEVLTDETIPIIAEAVVAEAEEKVFGTPEAPLYVSDKDKKNK